MVERGLYIIKDLYFDLLKKLGGAWDDEDRGKRPIYCCFEDRNIKGLYWAVPTSDLNHRNEKQIKKYNDFISKPSRDLRSCYYSIGSTTKKAVYKISSCFPITEKYIDHAFVSNGKHVIIRNNKAVKDIEKKLRRILAFESRRNNYFPQHITSIKNYLIKEINE